MARIVKHVVKRSGMEDKGEGLGVFSAQMSSDLEAIVAEYPRPMLLVFPDHLKFYVVQLIGESQIGHLFDSAVSLSKFKSTNKKTAVFITSSDNITLRSIVDALPRAPNSFKLVLQIPRQTSILETMIATAGFGLAKHNLPTDPKTQISLANFSGDFVAIEPDYFLMPCLGTFKKYAVDCDYDDLFTTSRALVKLQKVFGKIPQIVCIGSAAKRVRDTMRLFDSEIQEADSVPQFTSLILLDRACDLVTALASQANVEGTIKTAFGTNYNCVESRHVPYNEKDKEDKSGSQKLSDRLPVFSTVRSMSVLAANKYRAMLQAKLDEQRRFLMDKHTVTEITSNQELMKCVSLSFGMFKTYGILMNALQRLHELCPIRDSILTREFELLYGKVEIVDVAENLVTVYGDWKSALRLLALQSATGYGKVSWEKVQVELCAEFGLAAQNSLLDLEKVGLNSPQTVPIPLKLWGRKADELFADFDSDEGKPLSSEGSALGGFIPRSVRLVQRIVEGNMGAIPESVSKPLEIEVEGERPEQEPSKIMIFFIGGVTATEVLCLRALSRDLFQGRIEFVIGGTDEITCDSFMKQFFPFVYCD